MADDGQEIKGRFLPHAPTIPLPTSAVYGAPTAAHTEALSACGAVSPSTGAPKS